MSLLNTVRRWPLFRRILTAVFAVSAGGFATSMSLQYLGGMDPCVMCIQQRLAMLFAAVLSAAGLLLPLSKLWGRTLAALLAAAPAVFGLYIAVKQVRFQAMPPELQPSCGAPWQFRLRDWPLLEWYKPVIYGTGNCGEVYTLSGISLPLWGVLFFSVVLAALAAAWFFSLKRR